MKTLLYILLFTISFVWYADAQSFSEWQQFNRSLENYKSKRYQAAQKGFFVLLRKFPNGTLSTATQLMLAKCYYKQRIYAKAEITCKNFLEKYSFSSYTDDIHHLLGNLFFQKKRYEKAITEWGWVFQNSKDARLKRITGDYIFNTMELFLNYAQIRKFRRKFRDKEINGLVTIAIAKRMLREGNKDNAKSQLRTFLGEQPHHIYAGEAQRLLNETTVSSQYVQGGILYLKPSKGYTKEVADDLEQGMRYALTEHKKKHPRESPYFQAVEIAPNVKTAIRTAKQYIKTTNPVCLIGPIDSDICASLALLSRYEGRPYIVPLSAQAGLTNLSPYTFQINPDVHTKGRFLANHATGQMNARRVAVLAPANDYGEGFVQSFVENVQDAGGEVISVQWYYEGTQDLSRQFKAIRRQGFHSTFTDSIRREGLILNENELKIEYRNYINQIFAGVHPGSGLDSTDISCKGIDALLIILQSPKDMKYVADQVAFNNIRTQLLGNEGWNDKKRLRQYRSQLNGLIYITAGYYDANSWDYREFTSRFQRATKSKPRQFHLLGYDIMKWMLSNYQAGMTKDQLRDQLENAKHFKGILESIQFENIPRVNSSLTLLKLNVGQIIKLN